MRKKKFKLISKNNKTIKEPELPELLKEFKIFIDKITIVEIKYFSFNSDLFTNNIWINKIGNNKKYINSCKIISTDSKQR